MDEIKQRRDRLWNSLEMSVRRRNMLVYGISILVFFLLMRFNSLSLLFTLLMGPVLGVELYRTVKIFRKVEGYHFCRCKLTEPHQGWGRGAMCFTVLIDLPGEKRLPVDTGAIFASHGVVGPLLEEYINTEVTVGYNEETGTVVVMG